MKAIYFEQEGAAGEVLQFGERERPEPGPGEVLVRLRASAVNPSDVKKRAGLQPAGLDHGFVIPHSDGAGIIEGVGEGVSPARVGQRTWVYQAQYQRHLGTAAQYVCVPAERAAELPPEASFQVGACAGIPMMTAHRCVSIAGGVEDRTVLVTGASGRVGYYAAQLAKLQGARVIGTAGSAARCRVAEQAGCDLVLNYRDDDLVAAVTDFTDGQGVDRIVEVEFGSNVGTSVQLLVTGGIIATYSSSLDPEPRIPFYPLMFNNTSLHLVLVYNMPESAKQSAIDDINDLLGTSRLQHRIAEVHSLENTASAHEAIEEGGRDGCVVIDID